MGLFDRFTKGKKPAQETAPAPRIHPAISQLAKIYDSIHIQYEISRQDETWRLMAYLRTQAGNRHRILFCCDNENRNDIAILAVIKTPFSFEESIPDPVLMLVNNFNRQYRYMRFGFESGYISIRYEFPVCTANPGAVAREIAQFILMVSDDIHNELKKYA